MTRHVEPGSPTIFARLDTLPPADACPGGVGLTTGLEVLPGGWVVVGSLPTTARGAVPAVNPTGCLIVLDSRGIPVETWVSQDINGPWDMAMRAEPGQVALFVSNALARSARDRHRRRRDCALWCASASRYPPARGLG